MVGANLPSQFYYYYNCFVALKMPIKCAVPLCKSTPGDDRKVSFFKFPMDVPIILEQWIIAVNRRNWIPLASSRICQLHFKISDFSNPTGKVLRLKPDVIPTQNLHDINSDTNSSCSHQQNEILQSDLSICTMDTISAASSSEASSPISTEDNTKQADDTRSNVSGKAQKRKSTEILRSPEMKCRKLAKENEELKLKMASLVQQYEQQLSDQAEMFRTLMEKAKSDFKQKLVTEQATLIAQKVSVMLQGRFNVSIVYHHICNVSEIIFF